MEMPEWFQKDYETYQKWLNTDSTYLQVRANEILPYMKLVKEMAEALEESCEQDRKDFEKASGPGMTTLKMRFALKKFKEWK